MVAGWCGIGQGAAAGVSIAFMATQTTVTVTDDLDGSANAKEVTFSLNGESWTIDLGAKNRAALEKALKPYIAKATKQGRRRPAASVKKTARRAAAHGPGGGAGLGQEQRTPGQRPRPDQCRRPAGVRRRALILDGGPRPPTIGPGRNSQMPAT